MPGRREQLTKPPSSFVRAQARYFRALGDPTRLAILTTLLQRDATVHELAETIGASQSKVSNHLACLRWCQFVRTEREGRNVVYRLSDYSVESVLSLFESIPKARIAHLSTRTRGGPDWA